MSKKKKTNAAPKTAKKALLSVIPVFSAILLIFVVGIVVVLVSNANNKRPTFNGADDIYFEYGDMQVTKDELYTNMKIEYGAAELIRLIDEKLYAKEIEATKTPEMEEELVLFILDSLFGFESKDELEDNEDNQKVWDELIDSLKMNNLITDAQIGTDENATKVTNFESTVWAVVKDHYRLQFARTNWAKDAYVEQWKNNKLEENAENEVENPEALFTDKELEEKYKAEYEPKSYGLFIPFTSEAAAKAMMAKYGINTQSSTSINQNGWISDEYDYNKNDTSSKSSYKLSNQEVLTIFYQMYNEVYGHYLTDPTKAIIDLEEGTTDIDTSINHQAAFNEAVRNVENEFEELIVKGTVTLPTEVVVKDGINVAITWLVVENDYVACENNQLTLKSTEVGTKGSFELKATITLTVNENETYTKEVAFDAQSEVAEEADNVTVTVADVEAQVKYTLTTAFMDSFEDEENQPNEYSQFAWTSSQLNAIDSKLNSNLKYDGSLEPIVGNDDYAEFYKSYTVAPVKGTNFYFLMIKFAEVETVEFESVKAEIEEKLLEELKTDNNASKMIYEKRYDANLKIYDKYLEAIYDYDYTNFFETTLKLTDYKKFENSKKKQKSVVASFEVDGKTIEITAEELFNSLEEKYGVSIVIDFINSYQIVGNKEYNKFYNPYTEEVYNKKALKELFEGEVSSFRNNFELDYFTYSYLTYYGFIPNFPGSYGWNDFRQDYFGAYSDRDLLTNSSFGGYIYTKALDALKEKVYLDAHAENADQTYDELLKALITDQIEVIEQEHYSLTVVNLIISLDRNYDGTADNPLEEGVWTESQTLLAKELAELMYEKAPETLKATLAEQLTAIVAEYNDAAHNDEVWGKYKKAGLLAKAESANTYTNTSSIVEEFADELQVLWDEIKANGMLGKTLDAPLLSEEPFPSMYGYHHIAVVSTTEVTPLAEKEAQIELYYALTEYNAIKDNTYSFMEEEIEAKKVALELLLEKYGYNLELSKKENLTDEEKEILAESKADFLEKYGFDVDTLAFNEETQKALTTYYDAALTEVEGGDEMTNFTISVLKGQTFEFKANKEVRNAQLQKIVEVTEKTLAEEAEEGENA